MSLSCFDLGGETLSVVEASRALRELAPTPLGTEMLPLSALAGRVLAEDARSSIPVPHYTNAAMDGIALAWSIDSPSSRYRLVGEALAGHRYRGCLAAGEAISITTGAPLPEGADTVIMREQVSLVTEGTCHWAEVRHSDAVWHGQNVRWVGEDIAEGDCVMNAGTRLKAQHLGLLGSLGYAGARVYRRPRVAIFSTGDEVTAPGSDLPDDSIFDANRFSLQGMLAALGCEIIDMGIIADDLGTLRSALDDAAGHADMVITSGGVSVGQADWIKQAVIEIGKLGLWRIAMRPGRPLAFGTLGERRVPFFGLPGNPVAVMVTFLQFVQPLLRTLQGELNWQPQQLMAEALEPLSSRAGRVDYHRGIYTCNEQGQLSVRTTGPQGSGRLTSMVTANCLIEIEAARAEVAAGEIVTIQPFGELT